MQPTISSGARSTSSFQSGLPSIFAQRSQTAFTTAAVGEMDRALLRADPPQLAVRDEAAPEPAHIADDPVERAADDERLERADGGDAHLRAATAREGQPVPLDAVVRVGAEHDVGGRIVRVGVHRIRPVEPP